MQAVAASKMFGFIKVFMARYFSLGLFVFLFFLLLFNRHAKGGRT
jgi:hypothetical protein